MRLRVQFANGRRLIDVEEDGNVGDLRKAIEETVGTPNFTVKSGYPPRLLDLSVPHVSLASIGLRTNEQINVDCTPNETRVPDSQRSAQVEDPVPNKAVKRQTHPLGNLSDVKQAEKVKKEDTSAPEIDLPGRGVLTLRVQPDDNSCLFRAIGYLCMKSIDVMQDLRSLITATIQANPIEYSDAVLGMERDRYCAKMNRADTWGGEIEIKILSDHFDVQINTVDCKTGHVYRYGEGRPSCIYIVYSGIHYDSIALAHSADSPPEFDITQFSPLDGEVQEGVVKLINILRQRHYFTDTASFSLRCGDCGVGLKGEQEAQAHAIKTRHLNFGEY